MADDRDDGPAFRGGRDAADHEVPRGHELADLAALGGPIHLGHPRPERIVAARLGELRIEADLLERPRLARVDLGAFGDQPEDEVARLGPGGNDHGLDVVGAKRFGDLLEELVAGDGSSGHDVVLTPSCRPPRPPHRAEDLAGCRWSWQLAGALAAEPVEHQADVAPPRVGRRDARTLHDAGIRHQQEDEILGDDVRPQRPLGLGALDEPDRQLVAARPVRL